MFFCSVRSYEFAYKIEVRSFTRSWDNRGYFKTLSSSWIRPRSLLSKIFHGLLFGWILRIFWSNLKSIASPVYEITAIGVLIFGWRVRTPNLGEKEAAGSRWWYRSKERWWVPIGPPYSIVTFPLSLRISEILSLSCCSTPLFPHPTSSLRQISPCSPGSRWMASGLRRAKVLG